MPGTLVGTVCGENPREHPRCDHAEAEGTVEWHLKVGMVLSAFDRGREGFGACPPSPHEGDRAPSSGEFRADRAADERRKGHEWVAWPGASPGIHRAATERPLFRRADADMDLTFGRVGTASRRYVAVFATALWPCRNA